ncbi:MAG: hypothetical protein AAGA12_06860 [Pseudomonadota bacterium]
MKSTAVATVLSMALALTSFSTVPARADEDVLKVLGGIAGLVILNEIVKKNREPNTQVVTGATAPRLSINRQASNTRSLYRPYKKKRVVRKVNRVAPRQCLYNQWTYRGTIRVYDASCVRSFARVSGPRDCLREIRTRSGTRQFFTGTCLRQKGWTT